MFYEKIEVPVGRLVPAVARAFDILELFIERDTLSAPDITHHLGLPRTTVHELISTLLERSYLLEVGEDSKRFELGPATVALGQRYQERVDLSRQGQLVAQKVSEQCSETVQVGIRNEDSVIYVAKADSSHSVRMVSAIGRRLPAHCTAVGKVLLAGLSPSEFDRLYPPGSTLKKMTERSISSASELKEAIAQVRRDGIATEFCESNQDIACIAAPVYDFDGALVAGLSISVPVIRWTENVQTSLQEVIAKGANELSRRLGAPKDEN